MHCSAKTMNKTESFYDKASGTVNSSCKCLYA
jgi:hypothetical protein